MYEEWQTGRMPAGSQIFAATAEAPPVLLRRRWLGSDAFLSLVPAEFESGRCQYRVVPPGGWMMGGNYAASTDSRVSDLVDELLGHSMYGAIAVHDRTESARKD